MGLVKKFRKEKNKIILFFLPIPKLIHSFERNKDGPLPVICPNWQPDPP
ncbi:MAG TPA: hypothetical protein HA367_02475 [Candidatus Methanofastidiosum sp.]|nr:hypothetical protein [Methanofastidiosum sp.]